MFGIFKKKKAKSHLAMQIESRGLDAVTDDVVKGLLQLLGGTEYLYYFILAEIDGASMGNEKARKFARESGVSESQYKGQHQFEHPLIDGPNGAKTMMDVACLEMIDQQDLVVDFRLTTLDKLMRQVEAGKYDKEHRQKEATTAKFINSHGQLVPITGRVIKSDSRSLDGAEFRDKLKEFYSRLLGLSQRPTQKTCEMTVAPCDGSFWSWSFEFSDEEYNLSQEITSELHDYVQGWIVETTFPINKGRE